MKSLKRIFLFICVLACFFSCKQDQQTNHSDSKTVTNTHDTVIETKSGCDTDIKPCIDIRVEYPELANFSVGIKQSVYDYLLEYLADFMVTEQPIAQQNLPEFLQASASAIERDRNLATQQTDYRLHFTASEMFANDSLICIRQQYSLEEETRTMSGEGYAIFDLESENLLSLESIVFNESALHDLLLSKLKSSQGIPESDDISSVGFLFADEDFAVTDNLGISANEMFFTYLPQEIAPESAGLIRIVLNKTEVSQLLQPAFVKKWESR